jgi:hypothetical protein
LYGAFVWARKALNRPFRRFPARAVAFGDHLSVSLWFQRDDTALGNYMGLVNNGYYTSAGFEIRMGREEGGTSLGGGVITQGHDETWDVSGLSAAVGVWHHVALVYDSDSVFFFVDGKQTTAEADHGDVVARNTDVFIGQVRVSQTSGFSFF